MSINFPKEEERILAQWKEIGAFERQVELSKGRPPFAFYDGPPVSENAAVAVIGFAGS